MTETFPFTAEEDDGIWQMQPQELETGTQKRRLQSSGDEIETRSKKDRASKASRFWLWLYIENGTKEMLTN